MAEDTFPIQTSASDGSRQVVPQLDLSELEDALAPSLTHGAPWKESDASRPKVATPTKGPHRYTIYVPHDEMARINVGAGHPKLSEPGVSIDTKSHIHLNTFGPVSTYLGLGLEAANTGYTTNQQTGGYSLYTVGASNHWAMDQVSIASITEGMLVTSWEALFIGSFTDIATISGAKAVNASSAGNIVLSAGTEHKPTVGFWGTVQAVAKVVGEVNELAAPAAGAVGGEKGKKANENVKKATNYITKHSSKESEALAEYMLVNSSATIDKLAAHLLVTAGIVLKYKKERRNPKENETKMEKRKALGKMIVAVAQEIQKTIKDLKAHADGKEGEVKITATKNISISANGTASLAGVKGANVSGFKTATMNSFSSSVKGHNSAALWGGFGASVKSLAGDVELASDNKGVKLTGFKGVAISSESDKVTIAGEDNVQLNSSKKKAFVHGKAATYIGCGDGDAMGLLLEPQKLELGQVSTSGKFEEVKAKESDAVITMKPNKIKLRAKTNSEINVEKDQVRVKGGAVRLVSTEKNISLTTADKIILG